MIYAAPLRGRPVYLIRDDDITYSDHDNDGVLIAEFRSPMIALSLSRYLNETSCITISEITDKAKLSIIKGELVYNIVNLCRSIVAYDNQINWVDNFDNFKW
jgi:hypothetical protein